MTAFAKQVHASVPAAYDFSGVSTLVDVGGGHGSLIAAILSANPAMRGTLFDVLHVVDGAASILDATGVADRCERVGGDFFASVPEGRDAYVVATILHDWDDERATRILRSIRAAMREDSRLLIVDTVIPEGNGEFFGKLLDLEMLVMTPGGRERTEADFGALLAGAGFRMTGIIPTSSPMSVVEAVLDTNVSADSASNRALPGVEQIPPSGLPLLQMSTGLWLSQTLHAVAVLGVADLLADGPKTSDEIAANVGAHAPTMFRVMRALASVGVFVEVEPRRFALTPMAEFLRSDVPGSFHSWAIMRGDAWAWRSWGAMLHTVRTGENAFEHVFGKPVWEWFGEHPEPARVFDQTMTNMSSTFGPAIVAAYDWSTITQSSTSRAVTARSCD